MTANCGEVVIVISTLLRIMAAIDPNEQAKRAADAAWESARWAAWTFCASAVYALLTAGLLMGAFLAARYAKKTWEATRGQLENSNVQLGLAKTADLQREAVNVSTWLSIDREIIHVFVRNGNGGPIYDVHCHVWAKPDAVNPAPTVEIHHWPQIAVAPAAADAGKDQRLVLGPDAYVFEYTTPDGERHTKNGATDVKLESTDEWKIWDGNKSTTGLAVKLTFRDSKGTHWVRDWNGELFADLDKAVDVRLAPQALPHT